jgi:hypothetical protein
LFLSLFFKNFACPYEGSYATMMLRELTKESTDTSYHSSLTANTRDVDNLKKNTDSRAGHSHDVSLPENGNEHGNGKRLSENVTLANESDEDSRKRLKS